MSNFSALKLPSYVFTVANSGSINVTSSITVVSGTNQLFDWVSINKPAVYPGEAYYRSGSGDFELASTATDYTAEVIGVVEQSIPCAGSSSMAKLVYYGHITFASSSASSSITLTDGAPYFLATSSINTATQTGSVSVRNLTSNEPDISKPVFIAISSYEAIMVNYRGQVNSPAFSQSYFSPQSDWDCHCVDTQPPPNPVITPAIEVYIGTEPPA